MPQLTTVMNKVLLARLISASLQSWMRPAGTGIG